MSFITLLAFVLLAERYDIGAGAVLALAAAIKLSPVLLVLIFVMERRWRALASFVAVGGALALASVALAGWPLHAAFLEKISTVAGQVYFSRIVVSLELVLYQIGAMVDGTAQWSSFATDIKPEPVWVSWTVRAALVAGIVASWRFTWHLPERSRLLMRLFSLSLVILITNPLPWIHYLLLPLILLPGFGLFLPPRRLFMLITLVAALLSLPLFSWLANYEATAFLQIGLHLTVALSLLAFALGLSARNTRP